MNIQKIQSYNCNSKINQIKNNSISFKAFIDPEQMIRENGDGIIYNRGTIKNHTSIFRDGIRLFQQFPQLLEDRFPNGVKIFDYACSAGHEPSSIVMSIDDYMKPEKASLYYPIIAKDKNPKIINIAKDNEIKIHKGEIKYIDKHFPKIQLSDYMIPRSKVWRYSAKYYTKQDNLNKKIEYYQGDIFEDLKNNEINEPSVILFRNAWQYLTQKGTEDLTNLMGEHLPPRSLVIIGGYDRAFNDNVINSLQKNGFKAIDDSKYATRDKYFLDEGIGDYETLSKYCFEKI